MNTDPDKGIAAEGKGNGNFQQIASRLDDLLKPAVLSNESGDESGRGMKDLGRLNNGSGREEGKAILRGLVEHLDLDASVRLRNVSGPKVIDVSDLDDIKSNLVLSVEVSAIKYGESGGGQRHIILTAECFPNGPIDISIIRII